MKKLIIFQKMSKITNFLKTCFIAKYEDFHKSLKMKYSCAFKPDRQT